MTLREAPFLQLQTRLRENLQLGNSVEISLLVNEDTRRPLQSCEGDEELLKKKAQLVARRKLTNCGSV